MNKILLTLACLLCAYVSNGQRTDEQVIQLSQQENNQLSPPLKSAAEKATKIEDTREKAQKGDAEAMFDMGVFYMTGNGVKPDNDQSFYWFQRSAEAGHAAAWTQIGGFHKKGIGRPIDYEKAYEGYSKGAALDHPQGTYMKGYMEAKGLGCPQSYDTSVKTFRKGIAMNSLGCMYMMGLFYRNGFGVTMDKDSARYWLIKSADAGFTLAAQELRSKTAEYAPEVVEIVQRVDAAQKIAKKIDYPLNQFSKIPNQLHQEEVTGLFGGYLIMYDYSGTKIVEASPITLDVVLRDGVINAVWKEDGIAESLALNGVCTADKVIFKGANFVRPNHYHQEAPLTYEFREANLQLVKQDDEIILFGNLALYVPKLKEPQQPTRLILSKKATPTDLLSVKNGLFSNLQVFPNPFEQRLNVEFTIAHAEKVTVKAIAMDGQTYYASPATELQNGSYLFPIQINAPAGTYIVSLSAGTETKSMQVVKL